MNTTTVAIFFIVCFSPKPIVFGQTLFEEKNLYDKEANEIAYLFDCIKLNKKADRLIEWKVKHDGKTVNINIGNLAVKRGVSCEYKSRLVFFIFDKRTSGMFLDEISYYKNSFQKTIFDNDKLDQYKITDQTQFRVWMPKDRRSIYFCMINSDKIFIWVLSNGSTVYTSHSSLNKN